MLQLLAILPSCLFFALYAIWGERKISAFIQDRYGPNEVGPKGLFQTLADILKLMQKEDIVAKNNHKFFFKLAPIVLFVSVFIGFAVFPLGKGFSASPIEVGAYFLLAILGIDILGFLFAAWGSNSKFSMLAGMRTVAQMLSYEIPMSLVVLAIVMWHQSMNFEVIASEQGLGGGAQLFGMDLGRYGGFLSWNIIAYPLSIIGFVIFIICALAESNRTPFDHAEAESELIAGVMTEYSGFRFSIMALSEYIMMLMMGFLGAVLFFGGYHSPFPNIGNLELNTWTSGVSGEFSGFALGFFWLFLKAIVWVMICMWVRWSYPRVRIDQLMHLSWKVLTPFAMGFVVLTGLFKIIQVMS